MSAIEHSTSLREALYELSAAKGVPDAELLDEFVRRYPQYAADLTDFAVELVVADLRRANEQSHPGPSAETSPAVSRAMSRFNNRLYAVNKSKQTANSTPSASTIENPFVTLSREAIRSLADRLDVDLVLILKFRDRHIVPESVPDHFQQRLANELKVPVSIVTAHLGAGPQIESRMDFKAEGKPQTGARQTFEEAVRSSGLTSEQQKNLLRD